MKHYFITYGDNNYSKAKERILNEARETNAFDELCAFGPDDLSEKTLKNPLMKYKRGGGYWIWKADIVLQTFEKMDNDDILVYADSGCTLYNSVEWNRFFSVLKTKHLLVFRINHIVKKYTKKKLLENYTSNGLFFPNFYMIAAGVFFLRKTEQTVAFFKEWQDCLTFENVFDVAEDEYNQQCKGFIEHRHDQSVFTCLIYKYFQSGWIDIKWNNFDKRVYGQAIWASRLGDNENRSGGGLSGFKLFTKRSFVLPIRSLKEYFWEYLSKF